MGIYAIQLDEKEQVPELGVTQITLYNSPAAPSLARLIATNGEFLCYAVRGVCVCGMFNCDSLSVVIVRFVKAV